MFKGRFSETGTGLEFSEYTRLKLRKYIKENPGIPFEIEPVLPESSNQRKFFEGAVCPIVTYYQEGMDHNDWRDVKKVREWLKMEFNAEIIEIGGKAHKIAKTSKNALKDFMERVIEYVQDNYQLPDQALDPKSYKHWKDTVYPYGGPDNYIDYLREINILK